ncbi:hypothetical protein WwAna0440 [Wolbachia endosymbiont of Drosophila ananassae]|nr:hypothetical protein WwAna0440 [Wolbachia endosymbiont of Drosophila ananassae]
MSIVVVSAVALHARDESSDVITHPKIDDIAMSFPLSS